MTAYKEQLKQKQASLMNAAVKEYEQKREALRQVQKEAEARQAAEAAAAQAEEEEAKAMREKGVRPGPLPLTFKPPPTQPPGGTGPQ